MNYRIILEKRRLTSDNKYPLKIRLYDKRSYKDQSLNIYVHDLLIRNVGVNTIGIYLRTIRAIFNKSINERLTDNYPFKKFRIKQQPTPSRTLTAEELRRIINYECTGDREFNRDLC